MTLSEAADFLRFSVSTMHQRKDIPRHSVPGSRAYRYLRSELLAWLTGVAPAPSSDQETLPDEKPLELVTMDKTVGPVYHRSARYR